MLQLLLGNKNHLGEQGIFGAAEGESSWVCVQVGASNELPESEELDALYDRFLIRRHVAQVHLPPFSTKNHKYSPVCCQTSRFIRCAVILIAWSRRPTGPFYCSWV